MAGNSVSCRLHRHAPMTAHDGDGYKVVANTSVLGQRLAANAVCEARRAQAARVAQERHCGAMSVRADVGHCPKS